MGEDLDGDDGLSGVEGAHGDVHSRPEGGRRESQGGGDRRGGVVGVTEGSANSVSREETGVGVDLINGHSEGCQGLDLILIHASVLIVRTEHPSDVEVLHCESRFPTQDEQGPP